ncbi:pyridoxamine 5'-phosphate oxidase family protein [Halobacteria archaeon AArc-m2/3/4]|uniref:Pyridoxamine 5'-phosphate oxidase family protein n=1 Tax=Natronoglomus mannanivorans TaxID=2979990 RepID=A0AAP2Z2J8_9EURY|nr:pyridoxamine 5'-phosphate oxidase family protein [Halobacteria archaeon AArc-xg1-1]MCU4975821.1 pyridoxamine 5'-phosphate oxidase family protein [Halobacteria archaeon AArc-m2/3/4]
MDRNRLEYTYTFGMDDEQIEDRLQRRETGVLALAADGSAYAVPVAHHYEDESLYVRVADDGSSTKMTYLEETDEACFTLYDVDSAGNSWSIVVTGSIRKLSRAESERFDDTAINESFLDLRLFGEDVEAIDLEIYELEAKSIAGRQTGEG